MIVSASESAPSLQDRSAFGIRRSCVVFGNGACALINFSGGVMRSSSPPIMIVGIDICFRISESKRPRGGDIRTRPDTLLSDCVVKAAIDAPKE